MKSLSKHITEHFDSVNKQQTNEDQQFPVAFDYESGDYVTIKCDGDKTKEVCIVETVPGKNGESDTVTYECDGHSETIYVDDFIGKIVPTANESMKFNDLLIEFKIHDGKITTSGNKYSVVLGSDVVEFEKINPTTVKYEGDKYPIADFYDDVIVDKIY